MVFFQFGAEIFSYSLDKVFAAIPPNARVLVFMFSLMPFLPKRRYLIFIVFVFQRYWNLISNMMDLFSFCSFCECLALSFGGLKNNFVLFVSLFCN